MQLLIMLPYAFQEWQFPVDRHSWLFQRPGELPTCHQHHTHLPPQAPRRCLLRALGWPPSSQRTAGPSRAWERAHSWWSPTLKSNWKPGWIQVCSKLTCFTTPHTIRVHESFTCYLVCHPYVYIVQSFPDKSCLIKIITSCLKLLPSTRAYFFTLNGET